jgi:hypothetical protein
MYPNINYLPSTSLAFSNFVIKIFLLFQVCISCILYPICTTISNIFLVLTLTAYILLPSLHGPLFGKVVMAFVVALFAAYLTMTINAFGGPSFTAYDPIEVSEDDISGNETEVSPHDGINPACKFLGFLIQVNNQKVCVLK